MSTHYFLALPIEDERFARVQRDIISFYSYRRTYRPEEFHLTLQFLGTLDDDEVEAVKELTREVATSTAPFSLTFQQIDHFGKPDRPRVLTVVPDPSVDLTALTETLRRKLFDEITSLDRKPFVPHVTLAKKWDSGVRIPYIAPMFKIEEPVDAIILYRINPNHIPAYEAVEVFPLKRSEEETWRSRLKFLT
ncbi:RNA 2',3'-cyclic phosphodiesterase [Exiguobacterium sp. AM39-5BH]|uniref:RNA 2',3'-cyclic phosphodiesterase n=1 Tax=Exiguobacterium sp. AM39-5BH TaxID=2292355 RepID=UPI000FE187E8|nr:RNA 2',3'-cyclic phosphodiesterase [Exiguobacterium sp. AM39-5BH]RHB51699.1 RNA 2',3'-cyclic phosphodiesterase [Exiguobacterium sp. AM39-5BH]